MDKLGMIKALILIKLLISLSHKTSNKSFRIRALLHTICISMIGKF